MEPSIRVQKLYFSVIFLFMIGLIGYMAWPFFSSLIFAGIIAGAFFPVLNFFMNKFGWGRTLSAVVVCSLIILLVFLPCIYVIVRITQEVVLVYQKIQSPETEAVLRDTLFGDGYVAQVSQQAFEFVFADKKYELKTLLEILVDGAKKVSGPLLKSVNGFIGNIFGFLFQFFIMFLFIFVLFLQGPQLKKFLVELSPLDDEEEEMIIRKFNEMNFVTLIGNGLGGLIQGGLAGIAFAFAGIGSTMLWTVVMIIMAFIPLLGISIIFIPACLFLLAMGKVWTAGILFVFCLTLSLVVENWFKPFFLGKRVSMNSYLVFFSIIAGMSAFGIAGIFYGPLVISIFLTLVTLFEDKYARLF